MSDLLPAALTFAAGVLCALLLRPPWRLRAALGLSGAVGLAAALREAAGEGWVFGLLVGGLAFVTGILPHYVRAGLDRFWERAPQAYRAILASSRTLLFLWMAVLAAGLLALGVVYAMELEAVALRRRCEATEGPPAQVLDEFEGSAWMLNVRCREGAPAECTWRTPFGRHRCFFSDEGGVRRGSTGWSG